MCFQVHCIIHDDTKDYFIALCLTLLSALLQLHSKTSHIYKNLLHKCFGKCSLQAIHFFAHIEYSSVKIYKCFLSKCLSTVLRNHEEKTFYQSFI